MSRYYVRDTNLVNQRESYYFTSLAKESRDYFSFYSLLMRVASMQSPSLFGLSRSQILDRLLHGRFGYQICLLKCIFSLIFTDCSLIDVCFFKIYFQAFSWLICAVWRCRFHLRSWSWPLGEGFLLPHFPNSPTVRVVFVWRREIHSEVSRLLLDESL